MENIETNNNESVAQKIIDAIQREEQNDEIKLLINFANQYLLGNGDKPNFFDSFIEKTKNDLRTTVNGCVKSRNNEKKKDDLKKYKEGYINEIVQNANDVVWKVSEIKNPEITFEVNCEDDKYTVICTYPDEGFTLENIYGFCTRGNSDKKAENGQEGMYGIGIKSLLCFVDELHISSNINIDIISSDKKMLDDINISRADDRKNKLTTLWFSFRKDGKHAGFNTAKLTEFIDWIISDERKEDKQKYLYDGKDEEVIFDVRSLFFTELRGNGRSADNCIKKIKFKKSGDDDNRDVVINSIESLALIENECKVKIVEVLEHKYLLFHYDDKQISIAFEFDQKQEQEKKDRLYSTYFIGTYSNLKPILDVQLGCLINTTAINSSRSGLERENEKEPEILSEIKSKCKKTISVLCNLLWNEEDSNKKNIYTDILCQLLYRYRIQTDNDNKEEIIPNSIFEGKCDEISKTIAKWMFNGKKYILFEENGIENEAVTINRPPNSDNENIKKLYEIYKKKFYNISEENTDIILYKKNEYNQLTNGIKELCSFVFSDNWKSSGTWLYKLRLPFLKEIDTLIRERISGDEFSKIMTFLSKCEEEEKIYVKQLIARYNVNNCFNYMGNYSYKNIGNWLFDSESYGDKDYEKQCEQYKTSYGKLKDLLNRHISKSLYYRTTSNLAWYPERWWYKDWKLIEFNETIYDEQILMLLELIYKEYLYVGYNMDDKKQFITNRRNQNENNIILNNRRRLSVSWDGYFDYFSADLLNKCMESFIGFKKAREYIDTYNQVVANEFKINSPCSCSIKSINFDKLEPIFKWLAVYENIEKIEITLGKIECLSEQNAESDVIKFIKKFIGDDVYICFNKISVENKGKSYIGFITNLKSDKTKIYIKQSQKPEFIIWENLNEKNDEKFLLVYSSVDDEQRILAEILEKLEYGFDICQYIHNFIQTENRTEISSREFNKFISQKKLSYDYPFTYEQYNSYELDNNLSIDAIYTILAGEMSYDEHCPLCNSIPTLNIKEQDLTRLEKRNTLIVMFPAKYKNRVIYIKLLCCKSCFEQYKLTLTSADVEDGEDGLKILKLTQTVADSIRSRDLTTEIKLSPDNWRIIELFNGLS